MIKKSIQLFIVVMGITAFTACQNKSAVVEEETIQEEIKPDAVDTIEGLFAIINSSKGTMIGRLYNEKSPMTVANFVGLAEGVIPNSFRKIGQPYFDSLKFHRVISFFNGDNENFMIQGGDPLGNGTGGPGYNFKDEFSDLMMDKPGILAMANSGPATNGSQFFITLKATPFLDGKHTVFGELISGNEVPFMIKTNDIIYSIKILRKGVKAQAYDAVAEFNKGK